MMNSDQIKPAPEAEILEETDPETAAQLQEFYELLEEIKTRPDAEARLRLLNSYLKSLKDGLITPCKETLCPNT